MREPRWNLDAAVGRCLTSSDCGLLQLFRQTGGACPGRVREALTHHLAGDNGSAARTLLQQLSEPRRPVRGHAGPLPVPHPLDYDWRFTDGTVRDLLNLVPASAASVVLLGVPSLAVSLEDRWQGRAVLLDANAETVRAVALAARGVRSETIDLLASAPTGLPASSTVVADPPWYPDYIEAFLDCACRCTVAGDRVMLCLLGRGTRPGAARDAENAVRYAESVFLHVECVHEGMLAYETPLFEANALRAGGLGGTPPQWRRGDLYLLRRHEGTAPRWRPKSAAARWHQTDVNGVCIRVRPGALHPTFEPQLATIVPGDVLPSVSNRDPRRTQADVWTSGNRVYRCENRAALTATLDAVAIGADPVAVGEGIVARRLSHREAAAVRQVEAKIQGIVELESRESDGDA